MRRLLMIAAMTVVVVALAGVPAQARAHHHRICKTGDGNGYSTTDVRQAIWCATQHWSVPGGFSKALSVASCESGPDLLDHSTDGYAGTFQQSRTYWPGRVAGYNAATARPATVGPSVYWPRNNVLVSIRMAHLVGWGPWSCA